MSREDWYRSSEWSDEIEAAFSTKLRRAREKNQYLRIQASYLSKNRPEVALRLLDQYFELGDYFDHAQAHVTRAKAYISQGRLGEAVASYEAALEREAVRPSSLTQAYIELPFFIATESLSNLYPRALELLALHTHRLMFPVERFKWHAVHALIASATGRKADATENARSALAAAGVEHSGFRYHKGVGLVGAGYADVCDQLASLA